MDNKQISETTVTFDSNIVENLYDVQASTINHRIWMSNFIKYLIIDQINDSNEIIFVRNTVSNVIEIGWKDQKINLKDLLKSINFKYLNIPTDLVDQYAQIVTIPNLNCKYHSVRSYDEWKKSIDEFDILYETFSPAPNTDLSYSNSGLSKINPDGSKDYLSYGQLVFIHNYTTPEFSRIHNFLKNPNDDTIDISTSKQTLTELMLLGDAISEFSTRSKINPITNYFLGDYGLLVEPISAYQNDHEALLDLNTQMLLIGYSD